MPKSPEILCIYYSYSGQTAKLIRAFTEGFSQGGGKAVIVKLHPLKKIPFPFPSMATTLWMMFRTLFRVRDKVFEHAVAAGPFDAVLIGGPTWSYCPSGPVLAWLDEEGREVLTGKKTLPFISCRGYWNLHHLQLKRLIADRGGKPLKPIIFTHPVKEPWRSIGVFLSLIGRHPEKMPFLGKRYPGFGHSPAQIEEAGKLGKVFARKLKESPESDSVNNWQGLIG